jgi:uracil-DNA glycosylase
MLERDVILREIGLTPIWQLRGAVTEREDKSNSANAANETGRSAAVETSVEVAPQVEDGAERNERISALAWSDLAADIAKCTACKLSKTRTKTVPGVGNPSPEWMVIGEGPGESEDKQGEPFVGRAGQLLDQMLAAVGKSRKENVFIANVVKCRPPGNRDPEADEIEACAPYLERQIALAKPKLLLAVGKFAGQQMLATDATVGAMRASPGRRGDIAVVVTYHPAYLLRAPLEKAKAWEDLVAAKRLTDEME